MVTTIYDGKPGLSRRELLRRGGVGALLVISGSAVICPQYAWGVETAALKPETMKTLIQMARDIYPHDQLADRYYAIAVKSHDETAAKDPAHKDLIEQGVADLSDVRVVAAHGRRGAIGLRQRAARGERRHLRRSPSGARIPRSSRSGRAR